VVNREGGTFVGIIGLVQHQSIAVEIFCGKSYCLSPIALDRIHFRHQHRHFFADQRRRLPDRDAFLCHWVAPVALSIFDQLSVGVVLLDRSAKVVFANAAARALSEDGCSLHINSRVTSLSSEQASRLGNLIRSVLDGSSARTMSLPTGRGRPLMILASPVGGGDFSDIPNQRAAAAMLLICDPDRPAQIPAAWMMDAYGLTLAEVRAALSVASGTTISHTARRLKISVNTVKTHLRRAYEKTGTRRQADLSRMIATIGLLRGDEPKKPRHTQIASPTARKQEATALIRTHSLASEPTGLTFQLAGWRRE
jgi:DNA-binding CsgD family transcriptional regulator